MDDGWDRTSTVLRAEYEYEYEGGWLGSGDWELAARLDGVSPHRRRRQRAPALPEPTGKGLATGLGAGAK